MNDTRKLLIDGPARVARGAALLDEKRPGWAGRLLADVNRFDMADCHWCVLGTLYGIYRAGLDDLALLDGVEHGFHISSDELMEACFDLRSADRAIKRMWAALRDLWLAEARQRVAPALSAAQ